MISQIRNNLYLASYADVTPENVNKYQITMVLNVAGELPNTCFAKSVQVGFPDIVSAVKGVDIIAANKLKELLNSGEKVLVHCKAGASRSPHVVTLCLADMEGRKYDEVYKEVRGLHPRTIVYSMRQEMIDKGLVKTSRKNNATVAKLAHPWAITILLMKSMF